MQILLLRIFLFQTLIPFQNSSYIPVSDGENIVHQYYILSYNEDAEQANWVYFKLTKEMLVGDAKRSSNFRSDPFVSTGSASTKDYVKTGCDRGHLCPAADMKFDDRAMYESFYMSNISPQVPEFNRGIWKQLETKVRNWAHDKDSIYVVAGPIFSDMDTRIGENEVRVPTSFYKVLYEPAKERIIAFILPNKGSSIPLQEFVTTVDSVERVTSIDFFSQIPDNLENELESKIELSGWFENVSFSTSIPPKESDNTILILLMAIVGTIIIILVLKKLLNL